MSEYLPRIHPPVDAELVGRQDTEDRMRDFPPSLQDRHSIEITTEDPQEISLEIGRQAVARSSMHTNLEQALSIQPLSDLLEQSKENSELWQGDEFISEVITSLMSKAAELSEKRRLSSRDIKELKRMGILQGVDDATEKMFQTKLIPGKLITDLVGKFGIASEDKFVMTRLWGSEASPQLLLERIGKHLSVLEDLHELDATAPQAILKQFGIVHFGRYSPEQLLGQLNAFRDIEQGGDRPESVIMVVSATGDHNGAMDQVSMQHDHENIIAARKSNPEVPPVIFVEARRRDGLSNTMQMVADKMAPISTLFINAHGNEERIYLSSLGGGWIGGDGIGISKESMTLGSEICLQSCSTGVEFGVADKISEKLNKLVYATSKSAYNNEEPFGFEKDEHGDWHYIFNFTHKDGEIAVGHVFGGQEMLDEMPSDAELIWRGVKKQFHPRRTSKPSFPSRIMHRQKGSRHGVRRFSVND